MQSHDTLTSASVGDSLPASTSSLGRGCGLSLSPPGVPWTTKLLNRESSYCWNRYIFVNVAISIFSSPMF